ncbi:hypothetical protein [Allorhizobium sonneratiae]|uniref:hypothetical protein n=1 Tax=Allorhizobium sonneratiae TaxID=2934936 RepID=UPI002033954F|nr:hypothetical protein [Allorhizobium sonneratiae]
MAFRINRSKRTEKKARRKGVDIDLFARDQAGHGAQIARQTEKSGFFIIFSLVQQNTCRHMKNFAAYGKQPVLFRCQSGEGVGPTQEAILLHYDVFAHLQSPHTLKKFISIDIKRLDEGFQLCRVFFGQDPCRSMERGCLEKLLSAQIPASHVGLPDTKAPRCDVREALLKFKRLI